MTRVHLSTAYHWICPRCCRGNMDVGQDDKPPRRVTCGGCRAEFETLAAAATAGKEGG